jgi:gliding motility-associated-like protein
LLILFFVLLPGVASYAQRNNDKSTDTGNARGVSMISAPRPISNEATNRSNTSSSISSVINKYTPILALNDCNNQLVVENATGYNPGDTVLMIQMKGADIDSNNTALFGSITNFNGAGSYEFNYIKTRSGNVITLKNKIVRNFEIPGGKVQLVRVPYYSNAEIAGTLTCTPWDGSKGGVLVLLVNDTLTMNAGIDVKGKGFRGGSISNNPDGACGGGSSDFYYPLTQPGGSWVSGGAEKGEGIANSLSSSRMAGRGPLANGGGGGNKHNTGGGGGSNLGNGGKGGNELVGCPGLQSGGLGGHTLTAGILNGKIFLGGGGGCGDINNNVGTPGVSGGGIAIVQCNYLVANNNIIDADGNSQLTPGTGIADGAGGGGGGGSVLLDFNDHTGRLTVNARGGNGGNQLATYGCVGPGGGGGGGVVYLSAATAPASVEINIGGGNAGVFQSTGYSCSLSTYGAMPGIAADTLLGLVLPFSNTVFQPNIDSVAIKDSIVGCTLIDFNGIAHTNFSPVQNWQWYFGDGGTANTQHAIHNYTGIGVYVVKLVVTDNDGCKDSVEKNVHISFAPDAGPDLTLCRGDSVQLSIPVVSGNSYTWSPATFLNNPSIPNPIAFPPTTTRYFVTVTGSAGCLGTDSVTIRVIPPPVFGLTVNRTTTCSGDPVQFTATGGDMYLWTPGYLLNDSTLANPVATTNSNTIFQVRIISSTCTDTAWFSQLITINPKPLIDATKANDITCSQPYSQLEASGGIQYIWMPATGLNNNSIYNPIASTDSAITYTVSGTNGFGCTGSDTVTINVLRNGKGVYGLPDAFTPNNDGVNDCFGIGPWGSVRVYDFSVYNRWGERVWHTTDAKDCWNGVYKNVPQPAGTYIYYLSAKTICGNISRKGTITLMR